MYTSNGCCRLAGWGPPGSLSRRDATHHPGYAMNDQDGKTLDEHSKKILEMPRSYNITTEVYSGADGGLTTFT